MFSENLIIEILLVSLRVSPVLLFAPPFTLLRIPVLIRVFLALSLGAWLSSASQFSLDVSSLNQDFAAAMIISAAVSELLVGIAITLTLQIAYSALLIVGRSVDIQAGFGLALLADPTLRSQLPLVGTILAYGFGAVFFSVGGGRELLEIWWRSTEVLEVGSFNGVLPIFPLLEFLSQSLSLAMGLTAVVILTLFLIDLTVAFLSRTLPQMNALLLGFQIKTIAVLSTLPIALAFSLTVYLRLIRGGFRLSEAWF